MRRGSLGLKSGLLCALLLWAGSARAEVRVAMDVSSAGQLSPTTTQLSVEVKPAAGLARVTSTSIFANQAPTDFEADLLAQAPANSIITQFSYWYRGQRSLARIVEKARAAQIYSDATSPYRPVPRDPALVEMMARNKFRVRIAPVEAQKPLKVEIVWWQPLQKVGNEWHLTLPWRDRSRTSKAENLSLNVHFQTPVEDLDTPFAQAKTTPQTLEFFQAGGDNAATAQPATAELAFKSAEQPVILQSRSGGDAYFVAIVPEALWKRWEIWRLCYALHSHALGDGRRIVTGRFAKSSPAKTIGYSPANDKEATEKWWASLELDDKGYLTANSRNINEVIALSKRYGLPSQWTSWLAIPDSEREKLADIIDKEKIQRAYDERIRLGWALTQWKQSGKTNSPQFRAMLSDYNAATTLAKRDKTRPFEQIDLDAFFLQSAQNQLASNSRGLDVASIKLRRASVLTLLQGVAGADALRKQADAQVAAALRLEKSTREVKVLSDQALKTIMAGKPGEGFPQQIRSAMPADVGGYARLTEEIERVADETVKTRRTRPAVSKQLEQLLQALLDVCYARPTTEAEQATYLASAEGRVFGAKIYNLRQQIGSEIIAHREDGERYAQLRQELEAEIAKAGARFQNTEPELGTTIQETQLKLLKLQGTATLDEAAVANAQAELKRLAGFISEKTFAQAAETSRWNSWQGMEYLTPQWVLALKTGGANSPDVARLTAEIQKLFDARYAADTYKSSPENYKAETYLRKVEARELAPLAYPIYEELAEERSKPQLDEPKINQIIARLEAIQTASLYNKTQLTEAIPSYRYMVHERVLSRLYTEMNKPMPDAQNVAALTDRLAEIAPSSDPIYNKFWTGNEQNELRGTAKDYAQLRVSRMTQRAHAHSLATKITKSTPPATRQALRQEIAQWKKLDNQMRVRMGDPLIAVKAPPTARQVLAIFPGGELKKLAWNAATSQWEARFDVPTWASEGDYAVQIVVVFQNGARQKLTMHFAVDLVAPTGVGNLLADGKTWQLQLETDALTDRVTAFLPWNERIELRRDVRGTFAATIPLPPQFEAEEATVRFVLTDKAHNRTEIFLDWK